MNHIVYLDYKSNALELILTGKKTMLVKGAMSRRIPYNRVEEGDLLFFMNSRRDDSIKATAEVSNVYFSKGLTEDQSFDLLESYRSDLRLHTSQWKKYAGKRYLTLVSIHNVKKVSKTKLRAVLNHENDDWLLVASMDSILEHLDDNTISS